MTEFFTLDWLGTAAGMVAFVALMTEVCKFLVRRPVDPKWYCIGWAAAAMLVSSLWLNPVTDGPGVFTAFINLLLVATAATGTFEFAIKPAEKKIAQVREQKQQADKTSDESADITEVDE